MKNKKLVFHVGHAGAIAIAGRFTALRSAALVLAMVLCIGSAAKSARGDDKKSAPVSPGQTQGFYIEEDELNAYGAAKREPDPQKRATKLMEFLQKYPKSPLMEISDFGEVKVIEDEYNAFYAAGQESDYGKRSIRLIEFLQKYPKSSLGENATYEYVKILKETSQNKKYELLESLGERWLKLHPDDLNSLAFVAEATMNLRKYQKCGQYLEEIYRLQPTPNLAKEIHAMYQKAENLVKQLEWAEKLFKMPEFDSDYMLRYDYVVKFSKDNNLPKAAEYAQLALNSADLAGQKDARIREELREVRRGCHHVIASSLMGKGNYAEAIASFKRAVEAKRYGQGYYEIGVCLEYLKNIEEAIVYYAVAETLGEIDAQKAKSRLEVLYKALHNNTLIGIHKVYEKAQKLLSEQDNQVS